MSRLLSTVLVVICALTAPVHAQSDPKDYPSRPITFVVPFAAGGATSYRNLDGKCRGEHQTKTEEDRAAGLLTPRDPGSHGGRGGPGVAAVGLDRD